MNDNLFVALQRLAPQHCLSRAAGLIAESNNQFLKNTLINWFIAKYNVDMSEAAVENPESYANFNAFFTRALKSDARPIDNNNTLVSPADGAISQIGQIENGRIFQAKGQSFSLLELLGGNQQDAEAYLNGNFATIYLSPRDYHRVHMPLAGTLVRMTHIPGDLFSVNSSTAQNVARLYARNERVICHFETNAGAMAIVLVGAMIVASIETPWSGLVTPIKKQIRHINYRNQPVIQLAKGAEMGRFLLGSTAIVITSKDISRWHSELTENSSVRMGQVLADIDSKSP
jgi:phosphatidylserine decarboxylase